MSSHFFGQTNTQTAHMKWKWKKKEEKKELCWSFFFLLRQGALRCRSGDGAWRVFNRPYSILVLPQRPTPIPGLFGLKKKVFVFLCFSFSFHICWFCVCLLEEEEAGAKVELFLRLWLYESSSCVKELLLLWRGGGGGVSTKEMLQLTLFNQNVDVETSGADLAARMLVTANETSPRHVS